MNPVKLYRIGNYCYRIRVPFLPNLMTYVIRFIFACYFPSEIKAGKNLILGYGGLGVVVHKRVVIGNNCHIDQNVTIGGTSKKYGVPTIGDNVYIGAGAKILGPVQIGDDVVIGANSVIVRDVDSNSVVVGVPGKLVKKGIRKSDYV